MLFHVTHRSEQRKLMKSMHSTFENASMSLSKAELKWLTDFYHLTGIILKLPILDLKKVSVE